MENDNSDIPYKERFFTVWMNYFNFLVKNPDILSFIEQCSNIPLITDETRQKANAITAPLTDFITFGVTNNILQLSDIYLILSLIHGSVISLAKLHISGQLTVTEEVKLSVAEYSWKGLT
jgi:hypothetical protein